MALGNTLPPCVATLRVHPKLDGRSIANHDPIVSCNNLPCIEIGVVRGPTS